MLLRARFWRWLHCLTHLHRAATFRVSNIPIYIGCECGYASFGNKETADAVMYFLRRQQAALAPRGQDEETR